MTNATIMAAIVAAGAALLLHPSAGHAGSYGEAPWCAVQNLGAGDVVWDCEYQSLAQCQPQVIAGNRGFCNPNPRWQPAPAAMPRLRRHYRPY